VCAINPSCCDPNSLWDASCVNQAYTTCLGTTPSCTHSELTTGAKLDWICTGLTGAVCDVQASCCTTTWDASCVSLANKLNADPNATPYAGNCSEYACSNATCQAAGLSACDVCNCQIVTQAQAATTPISQAMPNMNLAFAPQAQPPAFNDFTFDKTESTGIGWKVLNPAPANVGNQYWDAILLVQGINNDYAAANADPGKEANWKLWFNAIRKAHPKYDDRIWMLGNEAVIVGGVTATSNSTAVLRMQNKIIEVVNKAVAAYPSTNVPIQIKIYSHSNGAVVVYDALQALKGNFTGTNILKGKSLYISLVAVQAAVGNNSLLGSNMSKTAGFISYKDGWGNQALGIPDGLVDVSGEYIWNTGDGFTSGMFVNTSVGFMSCKYSRAEAATNYPGKFVFRLLSYPIGHEYQIIFPTLQRDGWISSN
jgi:hypothetical protein